MDDEQTEFEKEYVSEDTIREELQEIETSKEIDFDDGWSEAKEKDLDILRTPIKTKSIKIPIDFKKKKYITFHIRELTTDEQLRMMEEFYQFDQKSGKASMKFLDFYRGVFTKMVKKTSPRITWKDGRLYNKRFVRILMKYLPSPFDLDSSLDENESKNSKQLSEVSLTTTRKQQ